MPKRFPSMVFYTPRELGGLGMLSIGNVYIQQQYRDSKYYIKGLNNEVPSIFNYFTDWKFEIEKSH